jgi:hypothetical protein
LTAKSSSFFIAKFWSVKILWESQQGILGSIQWLELCGKQSNFVSSHHDIYNQYHQIYTSIWFGATKKNFFPWHSLKRRRGKAARSFLRNQTRKRWSMISLWPNLRRIAKGPYSLSFFYYKRWTSTKNHFYSHSLRNNYKKVQNMTNSKEISLEFWFFWKLKCHV